MGTGVANVFVMEDYFAGKAKTALNVCPFGRDIALHHVEVHYRVPLVLGKFEQFLEHLFSQALTPKILADGK